MLRVNIKKLHNDAAIPEYKSSGAAGCDLYAITPMDTLTHQRLRIGPGERVLFPLGFAMEIPDGYEAQIRSRSSMALQGVIVVNQPGTIDSDYRGEVKVALWNTNESPVFIEHHQRIAQMVIAPVLQANFRVTSDITETERGHGGFGSTGRN